MKTKCDMPITIPGVSPVLLCRTFLSPRETDNMASGTATVKMVLSGDTVVLMGRAVNGPPPEMQLSLSSLIAPKLGRGPQSAEEVS